MARIIHFIGRKIQAGTDTHVTADGRAIARDVVIHPGAAGILPMVDDDHVCLLQNQRFISGETLWEIPAGTLDPGEAPAVAARRELMEETGYDAGRWRKLAEFFPSPGVLSERTHLYVAQDLIPGEQRLEPEEQLRPQVVTWRDALDWATSNQIRDAKTLVAILLWDRLRHEEI
jgi:ADP-ribose pyrophosphatase